MKWLYIFLIVFVCLVGLTDCAAADVPQTLSYQGVLTDASGTAVPDGIYSITFSIYDDPMGDPVPWSETRNVEVHRGVFSVVLGEIMPITVAFDRPYWLGISVAGEPELLPRTKLTSSPYSLNAREVRGANNLFPATGYAGIGTSMPNAPLHVVTQNINGLWIDGFAGGSWANMVLNAAGANSAPSYEYNRLGNYRARTYVDPQNNWKLQVGSSTLIAAMEGSNRVGLGGVTNPQEQLEVNGAIKLGYTGQMNPGTIRWTGMDFEGYDGVDWKSLTATGGGMPSGSLGQTLRHDGSTWVANSNLYNDGMGVGIGTSNPLFKLHVNGTARFDESLGQLYIHDMDDNATITAFAPNGNRRDIVFNDFGINITPSDSYTPQAAANGISISEQGTVSIGSGAHPSDFGLSVNREETGHTVAVGGQIGGVTSAMAVDVATLGRYESDDPTAMGIGVYGYAYASSGQQTGVYGASYGTGGFGVVSDGDFITIQGTKSAVVETADYGARKLYCLESAGNYFEDFGQGQLVNGEVTVAIDPVFAQTVNLSTTYHVFLTPMGDCGLYVASKTPSSFTVRALDGRQVSMSFDYRIVAKRSGYENERLAPVKIPTVMTRR
jgi:hypothetical protein